MSGQKRKEVMSGREMLGVADLTGQTIAGLEIQTMVARRPEPRYQTRCTRCGTIQTESQHDLTRGASRCRNTGCARQGLHEEANLTLAQFQRREAQKEQAKINAIKGSFERTARRVAEAERKSLLHLRDEDFRIDPAVAELVDGMSDYERSVFTQQESQRFVAENPGYLACPENAAVMTDYLTRNRAGESGVVTCALLTAAYLRLDSYGALRKRPEPQPEPVPAQIQMPPSEPEPMVGYDPRTGEKREFTRREVDLMSADDFRRIFRIYRSALSLPNIGPGSRRPR